MIIRGSNLVCSNGSTLGFFSISKMICVCELLTNLITFIELVENNLLHKGNLGLKSERSISNNNVKSEKIPQTNCKYDPLNRTVCNCQGRTTENRIYFSVHIWASDRSEQVTWPEYWPLIGRDRSRDLNAGLWLVETDHEMESGWVRALDARGLFELGQRKILLRKVWWWKH